MVSSSRTLFPNSSWSSGNSRRLRSCRRKRQRTASRWYSAASWACLRARSTRSHYSLIALADERLIAFDSVAHAWAWDIDRIHAKNYTDNVVDLMVRKLKRLPIATQDALKHLACLGNMAEIGRLSSIQDRTEEAMH